MSGAAGRPSREDTRERLLQEAWSLIQEARSKGELAVASATLERAARIAGIWSEKAGSNDPGSPPAARVFTSEPMTPEQWSETFAPNT